MNSEYQFLVQDMKITVEDIAVSIGYPRDQVPMKIATEIERLWKKYNGLIKPQAKIIYFPAVVGQNGFICGTVTFAVGKKIAARVAGMEQVALFVCSIGDELETEATRLSEAGELMHGYVLDAIGSLAAERLAELVQMRIENAVQATGKTISTRFSPGYCDWPVSAQHELFALLGGTPCGVALSVSAMMKPLKSISGFVGIGDNMTKGYACDVCEQQERCLYRNRRAKR